MTRAEVHRITGVSLTVIDQARRSGALPSVGRERLRRFWLPDVVAWVARGMPTEPEDIDPFEPSGRARE